MKSLKNICSKPNLVNCNGRRASAHTKRMETEYHDQILNCIQRSSVWQGCYASEAVAEVPCKKGKLTISVKDTDSVSALFHTGKGRQCLLNFASYTHPGGGFMNGSMAQEEALCHSSFLYNVLVAFQDSFYKQNAEDKNRSLYRDRCIYSPDIVFMKDGRTACSDVITCASPNWTAAHQNGCTKEENEMAVRSRIRFLLRVMADQHVNRMILGAFGCGVFGQNPGTVAKIFHEEIIHLFTGKEVEIVFAVPSGNGNFEAFKNEMK